MESPFRINNCNRAPKKKKKKKSTVLLGRTIISSKINYLHWYLKSNKTHLDFYYSNFTLSWATKTLLKHSKITIMHGFPYLHPFTPLLLYCTICHLLQLCSVYCKLLSFSFCHEQSTTFLKTLFPSNFWCRYPGWRLCRSPCSSSSALQAYESIKTVRQHRGPRSFGQPQSMPHECGYTRHSAAHREPLRSLQTHRPI